MKELKETVLVIGLGETGKPLYEIIKDSNKYDVFGKDIEPLNIKFPIDILHICIPYSKNYIKIVTDYIKLYKPKLVIINSTVIPGTTRKIYEKTNTLIVYSPIRGKHRRMKRDLLHYTKFIAGINKLAENKAYIHLTNIGMKVDTYPTIESLELAKLISTTYFGLLIAWAQEVERYAKQYNVSYDDLIKIFNEIPYFPKTKYTPGFIGGHCVMPNIKLLKKAVKKHIFLKPIEKSNKLKKKELEKLTEDIEFLKILKRI